MKLEYVLLGIILMILLIPSVNAMKVTGATQGWVARAISIEEPYFLEIDTSSITEDSDNITIFGRLWVDETNVSSSPDMKKLGVLMSDWPTSGKVQWKHRGDAGGWNNIGFDKFVKRKVTKGLQQGWLWNGIGLNNVYIELPFAQEDLDIVFKITMNVKPRLFLMYFGTGSTFWEIESTANQMYLQNDYFNYTFSARLQTDSPNSIDGMNLLGYNYDWYWMSDNTETMDALFEPSGTPARFLYHNAVTQTVTKVSDLDCHKLFCAIHSDHTGAGNEMSNRSVVIFDEGWIYDKIELSADVLPQANYTVNALLNGSGDNTGRWFFNNGTVTEFTIADAPATENAEILTEGWYVQQDVPQSIAYASIWNISQTPLIGEQRPKFTKISGNQGKGVSWEDLNFTGFKEPFEYYHYVREGLNDTRFSTTLGSYSCSSDTCYSDIGRRAWQGTFESLPTVRMGAGTVNVKSGWWFNVTPAANGTFEIMINATHNAQYQDPLGFVYIEVSLLTNHTTYWLYVNSTINDSITVYGNSFENTNYWGDLKNNWTSTDGDATFSEAATANSYNSNTSVFYYNGNLTGFSKLVTKEFYGQSFTAITGGEGASGPSALFDCTCSTIDSTRCGGDDSRSLYTCRQFTNTTCQWDYTNITYCEYGCFENSGTPTCVPKVDFCIDKCQPNQQICSNDGQWTYACTNTSTGCFGWNDIAGNKSYCEFGCDNGNCVNVTGKCNIGDRVCLGEHIYFCGDFNNDGFNEYSDFNRTFCQFGCTEIYNSTTQFLNVTCNFHSFDEIYGIRTSLTGLGDFLNYSAYSPNVKMGFWLVLSLFFLGLVGMITRGNEHVGEILLAIFMFMLIFGVFINWLPWFVGIITLIIGGMIYIYMRRGRDGEI